VSQENKGALDLYSNGNTIKSAAGNAANVISFASTALVADKRHVDFVDRNYTYIYIYILFLSHMKCWIFRVQASEDRDKRYPMRLAPQHRGSRAVRRVFGGTFENNRRRNTRLSSERIDRALARFSRSRASIPIKLNTPKASQRRTS